MKDPKQAERCAQYLKALADPIRLQVVGVLLDGQQSVSDVATQLSLDITTVSHHLRVLYNAGLVKTERDGRYIYYSLDPQIVTQRDSNVLDFGCCSFELSDQPVKSRTT